MFTSNKKLKINSLEIMTVQVTLTKSPPFVVGKGWRSTASKIENRNVYCCEFSFIQLFCCEKAKQLRDLLMGVREKLARKMSYKKSDVNLHAPIMSEEERGAINDQAKER